MGHAVRAPDEQAPRASDVAQAEAEHISPVAWLRRLRDTRWWPSASRDREVDAGRVAGEPGPPPLEPAIEGLESAASALAAVPALSDARAVARAVIEEAVGRVEAEVAALWEVAESRLQPLDGVGLTPNQARMPIPADQPVIAEVLTQASCRLLDLDDDIPPAALVRLPGLQAGRLLFVPLPSRPPVEAVLMLGGHRLGGDALAWARTFADEAAQHVVFALRLRRLVELARADDGLE
ncbi:MAG TPA: hypothetical protein VHF25_07135 [Nitriliruptorales bacterium]|nr:hypothetical protein [Nitriliruptorales bacterium]